MRRIAVHGISSHFPVLFHQHQAAHYNHHKEIEDGVANDCSWYSYPRKTDASVYEAKDDAGGSHNAMNFHQWGRDAFALEHYVAD